MSRPHDSRGELYATHQGGKCDRTPEFRPERDRVHNNEHDAHTAINLGQPPDDTDGPAAECYYREILHLEPLPSSSELGSRPLDSTIGEQRRDANSHSPSPFASPSSSRPPSSYGGSQSRDGRSLSPLSRVRNLIEDSFTGSAAGIGASLLGVVVGGFVVKEASEAALRRNGDSSRESTHRHSETNRPQAQAVATILGAVAGGLGANALANRVESSRNSNITGQHIWENRHMGDEDLPQYNVETRGRLAHRGGREYGGHHDEDYRVYDTKRYDGHPREHRGHENYHYRS